MIQPCAPPLLVHLLNCLLSHLCPLCRHKTGWEHIASLLLKNSYSVNLAVSLWGHRHHPCYFHVWLFLSKNLPFRHRINLVPIAWGILDSLWDGLAHSDFLSRLTLPFLKVYYKYKHISTKKKNKYRYHLQKFEYLWGIARYGGKSYNVQDTFVCPGQLSLALSLAGSSFSRSGSSPLTFSSWPRWPRNSFKLIDDGFRLSTQSARDSMHNPDIC